MNHTFSMEADEEDDEELGELCGEILENWNSPSPIYASHHNPFSVEHHQPLDDVQTVARKQDATYLETGTNHKQNSELEHNGKDSNDEEAKENSNNNARNEPSIVPVLVADTFFDKQLQRYVDGVNIAALTNVQAANAHENKAESSNGKRMEKLGSGQVSSLFKSNFPTVNEIPKRSPVERRHMQATRNEASVNNIRRGITRFVPPRSKTIFDINIDELAEKAWRNPGANISDFFNYGLDEKQWKDYCKWMQGQVRLRSFSQRKKDESTRSVEIAMHNSSYENDIKRQKIKENGVSTVDPGAILLPYGSYTQYMNCMMITGDKISPFLMDGYSAGDREWKEEQSQQYYNPHLTKYSRERKSDLLITNSEGVQMDYANRKFPTKFHNAGTKRKVKEDTQKLKRRQERFSSPLPILKNVVADTSMETETHTETGYMQF